MYDLNLLPIHLESGQPAVDTGGFMAINAPRRAARGRTEDTLILILNLSDGAVVTPETQLTWLNNLAQAYFKTSGSVTASLRSLIETLNLTVMEKNLKSEGIAVSGSINLAVVHRRSLYLAQSGPSHAYVLNAQGLHHFTDTGQTDRGLGISRTPAIRYFQAEVDNGAFLFTTDDEPPSSWTDLNLVTETFPGLEQMRRRLLNQASPNFKMTLTQLTPGQGRINLIRAGVRRAEVPQEEQPREPEPTIDQTTQSAVQAAPPEPELLSDDKQEPQAEPQIVNEDLPPRQPSHAGSTQSTEETGPVLRPQPPQQPQTSAQPPMSRLRSQQEPDNMHTGRRAQPRKETGIAAREALEKQKAHIEQGSLKGLAAVLTGWKRLREGVDTFFKDLILRWSPEGTEGPPTLSKRSLILIAVLVPLVLVAIAASVYLSRGKNQQYTYYLNQAMAYAEAASLTSDSGSAREAWAQTLELIDHAESYNTTDETSQVREWAQTSLDTLDGVVRLDYRPALTEDLYSEIEITEIALVNRDLYILDEAGGRVIHANQRTSGYEVDPDFVCAAGNFVGGSIGPLIDMVTLPLLNAYDGHVLAVDAAGNIAYCAAGQDPAVVALPQPSVGIGEIKSITLGSGYLYVLDSGSGSIWVYEGVNSVFSVAPTAFFEGVDLGSIPDLTQVADLAVNGLDLYMLKTDGMVTDCVSSSLESTPVSCETPETYVDGRTGLEEQLVAMPEGVFAGVTYTGYPDPSVSILDSTNGDIYRFSVRFRLYQRLRPDFGAYEVDSSTATAFTMIFDKQLYAFLAYGNQLFFAYVN